MEYEGPEWFPFEVLGYFEEFIDVEFNKLLGTRRLPEVTRLLGAAGRIEYDLKEPITLRKGTKTYVLKPPRYGTLRVATMIHIVCGATKVLPN